MNTKSIWVMAVWIAGLGAGSAILGCKKEEAAPSATVSAADRAAEQKAAADRAVAGKVAADKVAADNAAKQEKAEAAALPTGMVEAKAEMAKTMAQMDVTMAKLEALSVAAGDLDKPSEAALESIKALDADLQALKKRGDEMRDRGAADFEAWEKQLAAMSTPEVLAMATKRKDELATKYAEVLTSMQESRAALDAYLGDMKPIRKAVDDGLTSDTQKTLAPQVKSAKEKAATLKSRVEATAAKLAQVSLLYTKP